MPYKFTPSPHKSSRRGVAISAIILHFTAGASLNGCIQWFQNPKSKVSAHYVIGRYGDVVQMVQDEEKAWHAGNADLYGDPRVNTVSIGIEMVNWGRLEKDDDEFYCWPGGYARLYDEEKFGKPVLVGEDWWAPYTSEQFDACVALCSKLVDKYPDITIDRIVGHEQVAPKRKNDPGPAFDIERLREKVFTSPGAMYSEYDEIPEKELMEKQADRTEPEPESMSWVDRLMAAWRKRFRPSA